MRPRGRETLGGALLALAALSGSACGGDAQQTPPGDDAAALVLSSDPELAERAAALLPELARRAGLELRHPVRLERRSRADLLRYLEHKLDEELPEAEAEALVATYAFLGLVPDSLDLRALLLDLYTEQVAGFYEPDSTALFILDDQPPEALQGLLVHELVHAIQDQTADLAGLTDPALGNDRATAAQAAIEGQATLVMFEFMTEQATGRVIDLAEVPDFAAVIGPALEGMRDFPALAAAPRVVQESLLFPYLQGATFVQATWAGGDRAAPFGDRLPTSTEQVLTRDLTDEPTRVRLEVDGASVLYEDDLGQLELGVFLEAHLGTAGASAAAGWDGDRYVLIERPDGGRGLVVAVVWDDTAARDRFIGAVGGALARLPAGVGIESVDADGGPAALLRFGAAQGLGVRLRTGG